MPQLKSSITLPPEERKLVERLRKRTRAKSNVEVVRQGLRLLESSLDRKELRARFQMASELIRKTSQEDFAELDALSGEGLGDED